MPMARWLAKATIPADQTNSSSMRDIYNLTLDQKKYIVASQGPDTQIGGLYKSFMDEKAVEKVADKPLRAELAQDRRDPGQERVRPLHGRELRRVSAAR